MRGVRRGAAPRAWRPRVAPWRPGRVPVHHRLVAQCNVTAAGVAGLAEHSERVWAEPTVLGCRGAALRSVTEDLAWNTPSGVLGQSPIGLSLGVPER